MTNREFLSAIASAELSAELKEFASAELAKLDAKNEKRRNTMTKEQVANESLKKDIYQTIFGLSKTASEIASELSLSTQKVSALCRQLVTDGKATVEEVKSKNGKVKSYKGI